MPHRHRLQGLYVLTDENLIAPAQLHTAVAQAIEGGCRVVQYRDKHSPGQLRLQQALQLRALCDSMQATLIINDDVELALASEADGVHIGKHDSHIEDARQRLGEKKIIGVSCYNDFSLARQAERQGADYVAFGSFYSSAIKPEAVRASVDLLQQARRELAIPCVAIGGINPGNAAELIAAGADMIAVISAVFEGDGISDKARSLSELFDTSD